MIHRNLAAVAVVTAVALTVLARANAQTEPAAPTEASGSTPLQFDVVNVAGGRIASSDFAGSVVLLDLWATWCGPCEEALPFYATLHDRYAAQGLVVVAISIDDDLATVERFLRRIALPFAIGWDEGQIVANVLEPSTMPTSYLIGRDGTTRHVHVGFRSADRADIEAHVLAALAEPAPTAIDGSAEPEPTQAVQPTRQPSSAP